MSDKIKVTAFYTIMAACVAIAFIGLGGMLGYQRAMGKCQFMQPDTVYVHTIDSNAISGTAVRPEADSLIRQDSLPYPVPVPYPVYLPGDTVHEHDTILVYLPYDHRLFHIDDTLDVWYSGIDPSIDSIIVYSHTVTQTITQVQEVVKMPRLTADFGAGALYHENKVNPYLLGEVRYNARKTTFGVYGAINHEGKWGVGGNVTYRINILK